MANEVARDVALKKKKKLIKKKKVLVGDAPSEAVSKMSPSKKLKALKKKKTKKSEKVKDEEMPQSSSDIEQLDESNEETQVVKQEDDDGVQGSSEEGGSQDNRFNMDSRFKDEEVEVKDVDVKTEPSTGEEVKEEMHFTEMNTKPRQELCDDDGAHYVHPEDTLRKSGVIYFPTIPGGMTPTLLRREMNKFVPDCVGRMKLISTQELDSRKQGYQKLHYKEGWVEFKRKSVAKRIALSLNFTPVSTKLNHRNAEGHYWLCKYLPGFKWIHLMEQLDYEKKLNQDRMNVEIGKAKKIAENFTLQVERGENLKRLDERVLKKTGQWEQYRKKLENWEKRGDKIVEKQMKKEQEKQKKRREDRETRPSDDILQMIYAD